MKTNILIFCVLTLISFNAQSQDKVAVHIEKANQLIAPFYLSISDEGIVAQENKNSSRVLLYNFADIGSITNENEKVFLKCSSGNCITEKNTNPLQMSNSTVLICNSKRDAKKAVVELKAVQYAAEQQQKQLAFKNRMKNRNSNSSEKDNQSTFLQGGNNNGEFTYEAGTSFDSENRLTKNKTQSPDVDVNIPKTRAKQPTIYALIIGNEDYHTFQPELSSEVNVDYAANDAKVFKQYLIKTLGVPERNIDLQINATLGKMKQGIKHLKELAETNQGEAQLIFYYSGHGLPDEANREPYLIPVDISGSNVTEGIKLSGLFNDLTSFPVERVTVFLDACFSGGARNKELIALKGVKIKPKKSYLDGNIVVFASSSGNQSSGVYRDKSHGLFTFFLLEKIQQTKGNISYHELSAYLKKKVGVESVIVNNKKQTPEIFGSPAVNDKWGDWKLR